MAGHLVDRHPTVSPQRLIAQLVPPPTFDDVSFQTYRPDPDQPTQAAALADCLSFCDEAVRRRAGRKKMFGRREALPGVGLYLDGGFGVIGQRCLQPQPIVDVSLSGLVARAGAQRGAQT